jgi:hypothetical protein
VPESGYEVTPKSLTLLAPPAGPFELEVVTAIKPQDNSLLEGLYKSGGNYCTQVRGVLTSFTLSCAAVWCIILIAVRYCSTKSRGIPALR